jgi:hypothetical protein
MTDHSILTEVAAKCEGDLAWMLDLSLWFAWHSKSGTLPEGWKSLSPVEIAHQLGAPAWVPVKPWRAKYQGVDISIDESEDTRTIRYAVAGRTLSASWTLGPDNDWWQMDHLIAAPEDFQPALELAESLQYELEEQRLQNHEDASNRTLLVVELPRRPLSALLHDFLGWGEGLLMLHDHQDEVDMLLGILDAKIQALVESLTNLPGTALLSPDNLDGQYISPDLFEKYLSQSYAESCRQANAAGKAFVVHVGGPMQHLLEPMASSGIDVIEGVSGPPQSDAPIPAARQRSGPELTLWGGIPQDWLLDTIPAEEFEVSVREVIGQVKADGNAILGVADRVPVAAQKDRLESLSSIIRSTRGS